jgi:hypothetical protein
MVGIPDPRLLVVVLLDLATGRGLDAPHLVVGRAPQAEPTRQDVHVRDEGALNEDEEAEESLR